MATLDPGVLAARTLLVVEDEYFLAQDIARVFKNAGGTVVGPVANVDDALALAVETPALDGAVLDVNLMGEMVYPVADALRRRGVPFVFATGYDAAHISPVYRDVICIQKPVEPEKIAQALFG